MKELGLLCTKFGKRIRKFNLYKGKTEKIETNLINREFFANKTNQIWLTDVKDFILKRSEEKIYLSQY